LTGVPTFDLGGFLGEFRREAAARGFAECCLAETSSGPVLAFHRSGTGIGGYLSAGIHGDEPAGPLALLELLRRAAFAETGEWWLCPALNPTGLAAGRRENRDGLDLNRDYLRRDSAEVRAHAEWLERQSVPSFCVSLHEDWEASGFYLYEINLGVDDPARARALLAAAQPWFEVEPAGVIDEHEVREPGWIYHQARPDFPDHWPEAIFLAERGCPLSFTLETPSSHALESRVSAQVAVTRCLLARLHAGG
jgi:predicted deacylase